jgi:hypothetical protein
VKDLGLLVSHVSMSPPPIPRYHLPAQIHLFIGRSREVAEVKQLLHASRLLTLTGIGGTGKTQLALRGVAEVHERLKARSEEETTRRRRTEYFVSVAERAEPELRLAGCDHWSGRLELDMENIRAVLEWSLSGGDVEMAIRLACALCLFWYGNGYHVEGRRWTQQLLERLDEVPLIYHPKFLLSAGHLAFLYHNLTFIALHEGEAERARDLARQGLRLARAMNNKLELA